jgi:hypothetical protein
MSVAPPKGGRKPRPNEMQCRVGCLRRSGDHCSKSDDAEHWRDPEPIQRHHPPPWNIIVYINLAWEVADAQTQSLVNVSQ